MSDSGDSIKFKWTPESTSLLVSIWSDRQVQKQLEYAAKPQLIWESMARYMKKKGYNVSGKQCRSRMKQVLVCYREAKRVGTKAGVEQYYESIDRVLKDKRLEGNNINGIDTVDATANVKSPPKEMKTNKNLQMRHNFQEPVQSLLRTEALSPTWTLGRENEYPDSPESNETVIARPYRVFSPTRDVAINTGEQLAQLAGKTIQCNTFQAEEPLLVNYKQNLQLNYPYGEVPFQNTVQNVQNQIIQENMQQHQNLQQNRLWNQQNMMANNLNLQQNLPNLNHPVTAQTINVPMQMNSNVEMRQQNQLQQMWQMNNRAMPQEPRKVMFGQHMATNYKQGLMPMPAVMDLRQTDSSPDYSPDISQNLNDAFCQSKNDDKSHALNETYNQTTQVDPTRLRNPEISVITNNATCNDDSMLEFFIDSPTPSEVDNKLKDTAVNTEHSTPHAPFRKKKAQKLEQLVLSAISSQNEVVNKILAAQNDMVTKFLDIDRDRQNRLENRLDDLLKVVHTTVLTKQTSEPESEIPTPPPEPMITSLVPPPRPGAPPPKLDLVPPKPCRVPCTIPNSNVELINQNPITTRPGVVSPLMSPVKKPGTIWSKLGPVSQSPFVKAQQRLNLQPISVIDTRTHSSVERRIARELNRVPLDTATIILETRKLLEMERQQEEKVENARLENTMSQSLHSRRRLFTQREPTAAIILTASFLENECRAAEEALKYENEKIVGENKRNFKSREEDDLLSGQGESYERLRQLNIRGPSNIPGVEPCDTSTPAKLGPISNNNDRTSVKVPKQTIQQLAQLVMNSGRWKDLGQQKLPQARPNLEPDVQKIPTNLPSRENQAKSEQNVRDWMLNRYEDPRNDQKLQFESQKPKFPIGFTTTLIETENQKRKDLNDVCKPIVFNNNNNNNNKVYPDRKPSVRFMDEALVELYDMYLERMSNEQQQRNDSLPYVPGNGNAISNENRQMIEKYMYDLKPKAQRDTDSDNDEEFLDTTTTMMPAAVVPRRGSLTSTGTTSTETAHSIKFTKPDNCVIS